MKMLSIVAAVAAAAVTLGATSARPPASDFSARVDNVWFPLEPGTLDSKIYVRGVGTVLELTVKGGNERLELVSMTRPYGV